LLKKKLPQLVDTFVAELKKRKIDLRPSLKKAVQNGKEQKNLIE